MKEVMELGEQIANERNERLYMTEKELEQLYKDDYADMQYEKGKAEGIEQGKAEGIEYMIKALLIKEIPDNIIIETSGLTIEELERIKKDFYLR